MVMKDVVKHVEETGTCTRSLDLYYTSSCKRSAEVITTSAFSVNLSERYCDHVVAWANTATLGSTLYLVCHLQQAPESLYIYIMCEDMCCLLGRLSNVYHTQRLDMLYFMGEANG